MLAIVGDQKRKLQLQVLSLVSSLEHWAGAGTGSGLAALESSISNCSCCFLQFEACKAVWAALEMEIDPGRIYLFDHTDKIRIRVQLQALYYLFPPFAMA